MRVQFVFIFGLLSTMLPCLALAQSPTSCWIYTDTAAETAFRDAVTTDNLALAESLLLKGAGDVNFDSNGSCEPPLFYAIANRSVSMAQLLVKYGANVGFIVDRKGYRYTETALTAAVRTRSFAMMDYISRLPGVDLNAKNLEGETAIQIGMKLFDRNILIKDEFKIVLSLAANPKVDINTANNDGESTLQLGLGTYYNLNSSQLIAFRQDYLILAKVLIDRSNDFINHQARYSAPALYSTLDDKDTFDLINAHPLLKPFEVVPATIGGSDYNSLDAAVDGGALYALKQLLARSDLPSGAIEKIIFHRNISVANNSFETYGAIFDDPRISPNAINESGQSLLEFELTMTPGWSAQASIIEKILNLPGVDVNIHNGAPLKVAYENYSNCASTGRRHFCETSAEIVKLLQDHGAK